MYNIWMEGYSATGHSAVASKLGSFEGSSFKGACKSFMLDHDPKGAFYSVERNSYWGCRLYQTEQEARKSFG